MEETAEQSKPEIKNVTAAVSLEDHARIRALCQKHDTTAQAIIEYCLRLGLGRLEKFTIIAAELPKRKPLPWEKAKTDGA